MSDDFEKSIPFKPFENIGLCFSGGGYRATFFALGMLSYLDQVNYKNKSLLQSVKALSTVSGGTLTGVAYAKAIQAPDYDFKTFYKIFYDAFKPQNDKLLEKAIAKLEDDAVWKVNPHKKRSLINAFALTYSDMPLFSGTFKNLESKRNQQLEQVCFNATDFSYGLTFRFQNKGYFGNNPLYKSNQKEIKSLRNQMQLGDVIASSSCFPVGFEPLIFPDDYVKDQEQTAYKKLKELERFKYGVGIMDGGIADNQGIGSMMLINDRMKDRLDLIIINDVGSFKMPAWHQDSRSVGKSSSLETNINKILNYFTLKPLYYITLIVGLLILVLNWKLVFGLNVHNAMNVIGGFVSGIGLILTVLGYIASKIKKSAVARLKSLFDNNVPEPLMDDILTFQKLDITLIQRMLTDRFTSAMTMIDNVFLKQMRRLNYDLFYSKNQLKNKRITATVYKLNGLKTPYTSGPTYNKEIQPSPSKHLKKVCLTASETPTTLWWDKSDIANNRMDTLIACGQFTVCYELMDYILSLKKDESSTILDFTEIDRLFETLQADWLSFNEKPFWLMDKLK
ncbi:MAG: patatin-like phospholipase family protein [Aquaticitalea sp.]